MPVSHPVSAMKKEFARRDAETPPVLPYDIACVFVRKYEANRLVRLPKSCGGKKCCPVRRK